jgi:hypothetical protein
MLTLSSMEHVPPLLPLPEYVIDARAFAAHAVAHGTYVHAHSVHAAHALRAAAYARRFTA